MNKQRFNVGDKVTYKSSNDCHHKDRSTGYNYGGDEQGGFVGTVTKVNYYDERHDCYKIEVTSKDGWDFSMLEREFLEYDQEVTLKHQFKIGDVVCGHVNSSKVGTIIGFSKDGLRCMVEGWRGGHHGDNGSDYWYDHEGEPVEYYKGNDRYYLAINEIQKAPVTQVPPKQESLVGRTIRFNRTIPHCAEKGDCYVVAYDTEDAADPLNLIKYGAFDRDRLINGDCELMPKGWVEEKPIVEESDSYMIDMQEECKRRFPIGCKYIGVGNSHEITLMQDDYTYRIDEQNIWAHSGEGCLFKNGQFATLVSLPATISASMSIGDLTSGTSSVSIGMGFVPRQEFYMGIDAISGKDFHISGSLVHQKSIITKRNKKSIKLVIK